MQTWLFEEFRGYAYKRGSSIQANAQQGMSRKEESPR
jgi:hypothetical protein